MSAKDAIDQRKEIQNVSMGGAGIGKADSDFRPPSANFGYLGGM